MIVYFADRDLDVLAAASTGLPDGISIVSDTKTESLESGIKVFDVTFAYDDKSRSLVNENVSVGNFLLRSSDDEDEFYTIIQTEHDTDSQTVRAYAEDAGLDLLNTIVPSFTASESQSLEWYASKWLPEGWTIGINELSEATHKLQWDGESTLTERLLSIATEFDGELAFSYTIDRLKITERKVDFYEHRGSRQAIHQLMLGRDIAQIVTEKTIENLATAFSCTGGTPKGKNKPINLSGCNYSSDGTDTHTPADPDDPYQIVGKQVRCIPAMEKWKSKLDADGLLVRDYTYDTTDKKTLFSHAVAELKKVIDETVTYTIEFVKLPSDARVGDRINIIDDKNEVYVEGRILEMEKSITQERTSVVLGDYVVKTSGISDRLAALAEKVRDAALSATDIKVISSNGLIFNNTSITTTLTATVRYGDEVITNQTRLEEVFGDDVLIKWYHNGSLVGTGFTYSISSANASESIIARLED